jgi:ribosomal protein L11 methyltransferase
LGEQTAAGARLRYVQDQAWERVWLKDWTSQRFGRRLWVCPTTADPPADHEAVIVRLDPGMAFGTGSHPTTALCLEVLDSLPLLDRLVIDYGCGSGILGVAALKLGARQVVAVDIDPQALLATAENGRRNGVAENIVVQNIDAALPQGFCVLANILAGPLVELAPTLSKACMEGGYLVLSGLLRSQSEEVLAAYSETFDRVRIIERDEWCCVCARRVA